MVLASMRPPEFTGGNQLRSRRPAQEMEAASMRSPEFTGGNSLRPAHRVGRELHASMRPPEFTGGNLWAATSDSVLTMLQ